MINTIIGGIIIEILLGFLLAVVVKMAVDTIQLGESLIDKVLIALQIVLVLFACYLVLCAIITGVISAK